jgi:hypothetical protein
MVGIVLLLTGWIYLAALVNSGDGAGIGGE